MSFSSVAANYAASFQPRTNADLVAGFRPSELGAQVFGDVPARNAAMMQAMAAAGLEQFGASQRQKMALDTQKYATDAQLRDNLLNRQANRRSEMMRMAGTVLASSLPALSAQGAMQAVDPLGMVLGMNDFLARQQLDRQRRMRSSTNSLVAGLQQLSA